ncbi:hypothetical protein FRY74_06210 [Vicingus serpentipes]|uniref:Uncharacterized protein n=1 Tax=Vicingus serpentipes TaxID=1926625 RepID=A0A5C6RVC8_9FLAO|nr:hypothetical protein [Vicingus serpentipes]TXB66163.1 hypothetical protein FRY74_06210 [Vicingus serpentipes]
MATFIGTAEEFKKYLGAWCRNSVQNTTRKYKYNQGHHNGFCQDCKKQKKPLDAAHIESRVDIITEILDSNFKEKTFKGNISSYNVDLTKFKDIFIDIHSIDKLGKVIRVLCKDCHKEYDKK